MSQQPVSAIDLMGQEINPGDWVAYPQNFGQPFSILFGNVHAVTKTGKPRLNLYGFAAHCPPFRNGVTGYWLKTNHHSPNTVHSVDRLWKLVEHQLPAGLLEYHKRQSN